MVRRSLIGSMIAGVAAFVTGRTRAVSASQLSPERQAQVDAMRDRMLAAIPYRRLTVPGADALAEWERLRASGQGWPVVIGDDDALELIAEQFSLDDPAVFPQPQGHASTPPRTPADIIAAADTVRLPDALKAFWKDQYGGDDAAMPQIGEWPATTSDLAVGLTVARDMATDKPFDRVHILILPTQDSSEVPAYLRWGNWNACPPPEIHVAVLRDWRRRYGTELVGIDGDTMNLLAGQEVTTRDEAMALAREQYFYCADIVDQGTGTFAPLAATLMASRWWFFWWD
jgi:hypothetical protein